MPTPRKRHNQNSRIGKEFDNVRRKDKYPRILISIDVVLTVRTEINSNINNTINNNLRIINYHESRIKILKEITA